MAGIAAEAHTVNAIAKNGLSADTLLSFDMTQDWTLDEMLEGLMLIPGIKL